MTRLFDHVAWAVWVRLPLDWEHRDVHSLRYRLTQWLHRRVRDAIHVRGFIP